MVSRKLFSTVCFLFLVVFPLTAPCDDEKGTRPHEDSKKLESEGYRKNATPYMTNRVKELLREIDILNLLNGLNLSDQQMLSLMAVGLEADRLRAAARKDIEELNVKMEKALRTLHTQIVEKHFTATEGLTALAVCARDFANARCKACETSAKLEGELGKLEKKVRKIVTPAQVEVVNNYASCLIPSKLQKDPTRIGQANENIGKYETLLARIRGTPSNKWEAVAEELLKTHFDYLEHHYYTFTEDEHKTERERVLQIVKKALALDEVDFQLNKTALSLEIEDFGKKKQPGKDKKPAEAG
jgi:hypothetical protein